MIASPDALVMDGEGLERATAHPVRSTWRRPDEPSSVPDSDAVVVAPATFNAIIEWVAGIADTKASATLSEYPGRSAPMVVAPCVNPDLSRHPTFRRNPGVLAEWGVTVLFDDAPPHSARMVTWERVVDDVDAAIAGRAGEEPP